MEGKRVKDSQVTINHFMLPQHANPTGNIHGGVIMKLVDETGGLCAMRHAQCRVVTVAIDSMTFHSPIQVGNMVILKASLNWVGRSSMEEGVQVTAEDPLTGECTHTNTAYLVYVALDEDSRPTRVRPLILETDEERRRWVEAEGRQQKRLKR
jgi:acyl-CoA hydrolase